MEYFIEGTVSEVTVSKKENTQNPNGNNNCNTVSFRITGTEGYSIKQDKNKYNLFRLKEPQDDDKFQQCYIAGQKVLFLVSDDYENLLLQASAHGKKINFSISEEHLNSYTQNGNKSNISIQDVSITLLSN